MYRYFVFFSLLVAGCDAFPWLEQRVNLPDKSTVVRMMIRAGGEYRTVVENRYGSASASFVSIGSRRTNLYLTPDHQLVTIEAGGSSACFDISPGKAPRDVTARTDPFIDSRIGEKASVGWHYIGVVVLGREGLQFHRPTEAPECIPLLGAGSTPFRKHYQVEHHC